MTLTFICLELCEVGHWAETFQVASGTNKGPKPPRPQQVCEEPCRAEHLQPIQQQLQSVTEQPQQPAVQPLLEKVTAIEALEPLKDIDEFRQSFGLVGFYRKCTHSLQMLRHALTPC